MLIFERFEPGLLETAGRDVERLTLTLTNQACEKQPDVMFSLYAHRAGLPRVLVLGHAAGDTAGGTAGDNARNSWWGVAGQGQLHGGAHGLTPADLPFAPWYPCACVPPQTLRGDEVSRQYSEHLFRDFLPALRLCPQMLGEEGQRGGEGEGWVVDADRWVVDGDRWQTWTLDGYLNPKP